MNNIMYTTEGDLAVDDLIRRWLREGWTFVKAKKELYTLARTADFAEATDSYVVDVFFSIFYDPETDRPEDWNF